MISRLNDLQLPHYEYEPLVAPDHIRVLELSPSREQICVHIKQVPKTVPHYEALSYVWRAPHQAAEAIVLDEFGRPFGWIPLTANLGNAMRGLRDAKELEEKVFWIDQICINQSDQKEKGHQVAMMSQIYAHAKRVIIYMGPAGPNDEEMRGISLLQKITDCVPDGTFKNMIGLPSYLEVLEAIRDRRIPIHPLPPELQLETGTDEHEIARRYIDDGWRWVIQIAHGDWTGRLWMVQERIYHSSSRGPALGMGHHSPCSYST